MTLWVGTNYHPHDWAEERWITDINLMKEAGFSIVRVGHLCWDSYEPEEGVYTFSWFDKVMDLFADAGLKVLLDISTRPAPVWVHKLCPGCAIHSKGGQEQSSIRRYMEDVDDPAYQMYALRFAEVLVNRYKNHPALAAFGICNELGQGYVSYSPYAKNRFQNWLKKKYHTIDNLNQIWATRRWSRRFSSFADVYLPENAVATGSPEAWLDMRRFFSDGISNFIIRLKEVISKNAPEVPHSSNHYSGRDKLGFDYLKVVDKFVDHPGIGYYPFYDLDGRFQRCLTVIKLRQSELDVPMWFLEFQTGRNGIFCGPKGYTRMQLLLSLLNRGEMFFAWSWRTMLAGEEQFHHGLLGHDAYPTPNYYEFQQAAFDMKKLEKYAFPYSPKPEIAVAYNQESWWVSQYQKGQFRQSYTDSILQTHEVFYHRNLEYNVCDLRNLKKKYKLIVIPQHIIIEPQVAETIKKYVYDGGTVVMTGYSGTLDESGKAFSHSKPGNVADVFGIRVSGFYRTDIKGFWSKDSVIKSFNGKPCETLFVNKGDENIEISVDYYEHLELNDAKYFASFNDKDMCAISVNEFGRGKAYYIATETNQKLLGWLIDYLLDELEIEGSPVVPEGIQVRRIAEDQVFYVNTTNTDIQILLEHPGKGILREQFYESSIVLKPYDAELIVSSS